MTDYSPYQGTWAIDPTHTRLGFVARHAMVAKVRGQFDDFAGTITIDAANPSASTAQVTVQLASVNTGTADRDAHLRSADFFDVEQNKEMTFTSTGVKQDGDEFVMLGDLSIKGVTRPVELTLEPTGVATDPFGNVRAGFEGETELSRKDFGLTWNVALEAGGVLVSDTIKVQLDVSAVKQA
ncbi:MAG TPA: YceI family protein [Candidatus Nanopelagicales bacterium]